MKRLLIVLWCICLLAGPLPRVEAQSSFVLDPQLFHWLQANISPSTHLPYSFYIAEKDKPKIYRQMESSGPLKGSIERTITHEGIDIYDGAVYQMVLAMAGGGKNLDQATLVDHYYWQGSVGETWNIRSGWPINTFIYDPKDPDRVSSDISQLGQRGFIFRILDADGQFLVTDPLNGKKYLRGFPDGNRLHWVDWKPVAGENAWVVMAALQIYHKKYFDPARGVYQQHPENVELRLSQELARAAIILQSDIGGIRMAPLGTHRDLTPGEERYFSKTNWWYNHISTENNISWYGAFRMLYKITGNVQYKKAMEGIENYLKFVWDPDQSLLDQGAYFINGHWRVSREHFALDVQTWGIDCLSPQNLDAWFGIGASWRLWQRARARAGVFDKQGHLLGVGYTDEHNRVSVEWSAGALMALGELTQYYKVKDPSIAAQTLAEKLSMRQSMEKLHYKISPSLAAYSYSSRRDEIPFGWNSHEPKVLSLASTGWMIFVDAGFNPFWLL